MPTTNRDTSAKHLTSLTLDISKLKQQLETAGSDFDKLTKKAVDDAKTIKEVYSNIVVNAGATNIQGNAAGSTSAVSQQKNIQEAVAKSTTKVDSLILRIQTLRNALAGLGLSTPELTNLQNQFAGLETRAQNLRLAIEQGNVTVKEASQKYKELNKEVKDFAGQNQNLQRVYKEMAGGKLVNVDKIRQLNLEIQNFVNSLNNTRNASKALGTIPTEANNALSSIQKLNDIAQRNQTVTKAQAEEYERLRNVLKNLQLQLAAAPTTQQANNAISVNIKQIEKLALAYARLVNQIQGKNVQSPELNALVQNAKGYEQVLNNLIRNANILGTVTPRMAQQFDQVANALTPLQRQFEHLIPEIRQANQEYKQIEQSINTTIRALTKLEKNIVTDQGRQQVANLRQEFQRLAGNLRNLSVGEAQSQLQALNSRFTDLSRTVPTATNLLNRFVRALSDRVRWTVAYAFINAIFSSFSNVVKVIRETEDSVIELQRVLNNPPAQNTIADELNEIAFEYGQTFANVQEVAVRFAQAGYSWNEVIEATRSTMLGLNTAELQVDTATQGLIAVMAQFNLEASDLEEVIDKINKTADNFPVTSEKIVAALQRAGGTASAFGMTLEETIGTITALSAATGRSGEAIGTAMNSLISFTMKESSLKTFAEYFSQIEKYADLTAESLAKMNVYEIWNKLSEAMGNGNDQLAQMLATSEDFKDLLNEDMASAIGLTDEYNAAVAEVNQQLVNQEDIYSTVGVYRKNYFIALLNNIGTANEALRKMNNAIGYSQQENETAMQALSKQFNQLVIAARELAVEFGDSGFLDFLKVITAIATEALRGVKSLGGLKTVLLALTAIMISVKRLTFGRVINNIKAAFMGMATSLTVVNRAMRVYQLSMAMGATSTQALGTAITFVVRSIKSLGGVVTIITLLATAWSFVTNKIKEHNEELEEARQQYVSTGKEATEQLDKMYVAYKNLEKAQKSGNSEEIRKAQIALAESAGYTAKDLAVLTERAGSLDAALEKLTETEYRQLKAQAQLGAEKTAGDFKKITEQFHTYNEATRDSVELLEQYEIKLKEVMGNTYNFATIQSYEDAIKTVENLDKVLAEMEKTWTSQELTTNEVYKAVVSFRGQLSKLIEDNKDLVEYGSLLSDTFEGYVENVDAATNITNALLNGNEKAILSFEELEERLKTISDEFDNLNNKVDDFQSAYSTLNDVIAEYNQTGLLTADMLQSLLALEPQYLELLEVKNGVMSINDEALGNIIANNDTYIDQLIALKIAEEADTLAKELQAYATQDLTTAELEAAIASMTLSSDIANAALACLRGADDADTFRKAIADLGEQAGLTGNTLDLFSDKVFGIFSMMSNLRSLFTDTSPELGTGSKRVPRYYSTKTSSSGGSSKSTQDKLKDELKERLEVYEHSIFLLEKNKGDSQQIIAIYKKMQDEIHALAEKYRAMGISENDSLIADLQQNWWKYQDEILKMLDGIYDANVKAHENAINLLENQYNQLERLTDYSSMTENLRKQYDEQRKIQEAAHNEAQRLRQMGVDENDEAIQECIKAWWSAEDAIQEINSKIEENILNTYDDFLDMADKFDLWDYMDFSKVDYLQEKLGAVNQLLTEGTISLKEYNAQLKEIGQALYEAQVEKFEKQQKDIKDYYDNLVKTHKENIDNLKDEKNNLKDYYDNLIDGYKAEIEIWNKRKEEIEDYYDKLIENLQDVQQANERINKQIDYFNERQKIITNLEQAQARSGVAWREKEMEYQQQLIDLDEEWSRTQKEWNIEDQIARLEELKTIALSDVDMTIEKINQNISDMEAKSTAAIAKIDNEIKGIENTIDELEKKAEDEIAEIDERIKDLSKSIAEAIKNGTADGLIDTSKEFDNASKEVIKVLGGKVVEGQTIINDSAKETAEQSLAIVDNRLFQPIKNDINEVAELLKTSVVASAEQAATNSLNAFKKSLVTPLQTELQNIMKQSQTSSNNLLVSKNPTVISKSSKGITGSSTTPTTVFINNNVSSLSKANSKVQNLLQNLRV